MKPIKLLSLWYGPLPSYIYGFLERVQRYVDFEVVQIPLQELRALVEDTTGYVCGKDTPYATCDLRPAFGEIFSSRFHRREWWGWCDLDVVFGRMDHFLTPNVFERYDVITGCSYAVDGPFTIVRNTPEMCALYRGDEFAECCADWTYCNYDETRHRGAPDPDHGFTRAVKDGARPLFAPWSSHDRKVPECAVMASGESLLEIPGGREILYYHFPRSKRWPLV